MEDETNKTAQTESLGSASENPTAEASQPAEENAPQLQKLSEYEAAFRKLFGIAEDEEIGDLDDRISTFSAEREKLLEAAKNKVIDAGISSLEGYNGKLLARLIDRTKITVDENGNITGLAEAAKAVAEEFPDVAAKKNRQPFVPSNPPAQDSTSKTMNDLIRGRR